MEEVTEEATLVLVDACDNVVGSAAPEDVGTKLHRTASLFVLDFESESILVTKSTKTHVRNRNQGLTGTARFARISSPHMLVYFFQLWTAFVTATPLFGMIPAETVSPTRNITTGDQTDVVGVRNAVIRRAIEQGSGNVCAEDKLQFVGRMHHSGSTTSFMEYVFVCHSTKIHFSAETLGDSMWVSRTNLISFLTANEVDQAFYSVASQLLKLTDTDSNWKDILSKNTQRIIKVEPTPQQPIGDLRYVRLRALNKKNVVARSYISRRTSTLNPTIVRSKNSSAAKSKVPMEKLLHIKSRSSNSSCMSTKCGLRSPTSIYPLYQAI